jgi:hypothetical protein
LIAVSRSSSCSGLARACLALLLALGWYAAADQAPTVPTAPKTETPQVAAPQAPKATTADQLKQADQLLADGKKDEAEKVLLQAVKDAPRDTAPMLRLASLYESLDRKEEAFELCAHILTNLDPKQAEAETMIQRLVYRGRFLRECPVSFLKYVPVSASVDSCRLSREFRFSGEPERYFAYTTSLLFPEELTSGKPAPWIPLPTSIGKAASTMYNRLAYGMLGDPGGEILRTRWLLGYPSSTILTSGKDYSPLAGHVLQVFLRTHVYAQEYLGLDRVNTEGLPIRVYLTEEGPTGAEEDDGKVFFFNVGNGRESVEWLREVCHEAGHLFLPQIGPFEGDDRWANGAVGERLFMQWLMEEAGNVAGERWPSEAAGEALDNMWGADHVAADRYLLRDCRLPLNAWLSQPPESFQGKDACELFAGFCLWVQAAHGRPFLAATLREATGATPADILAAYRRIIAKVTAGHPLSLDAGSLNPVASKLSQPLREGAVRRESVVLGQDGYAVLRVYLPAGKWTATIAHNGPGAAKLAMTTDGQGLVMGPDKTPLDLGELADGWHEIKVLCLSPGPIELFGLTFSSHAPEAREPEQTPAP